MEPSKPQNQAQGDSRLHFLDYWRIIRIRKTVILAVFLLVVLTSIGVTMILPKSYMSMVRISVDKDVTDINTLGISQVSSQFDPYFITTEFEKIRSRSVLYRVISNLNLTVRWGERMNNGVPLTMDEAYLVLSKSMLDLQQTRNTSLIEIRVYSEAKDRPAEEAAEIANMIAGVYKTNRLDLKMESSRRGIETLDRQLTEQTRNVERLQKELDDLKLELKVSDFVAEGTSVPSTLEPETVRQLEAQRIQVQAQYSGMAELLSQIKELREKGGDVSKAILTAYPDQALDKLSQDLWFTEANLAKQRQIYGEEHPEITSLRAMQQDLTEKVEAKIEGIIQGLDTRVAAEKAKLDRLAQEVDNAKQNEAEMTEKYRPYFSKKRELENVQKIRDAILLRKLQEEVDLSIPRSQIVEIVDGAEPARRPVRPNVPLNIVLGVIVGLVVGVGLAFFIEYLDTSVKTIDDVERALQAPVLGVIPQNVGSLLDEGPESSHAEAYRVLRTNMLFTRKLEQMHTVTVVSGGAGEGKSTTIFNLATVFSQSGQRVLLVDSDLRRPSLHKIFRLSNTIGLTNYLLGQNKLEEVIQTTKSPMLDFLPSGKLPSSSLSILNSKAMRDLVKEVSQRYDYVFFDSPPIMGVSDASVLASIVDGTLLVIQYRKYPQAMTVRAKQMVEKVGGKLLGVVLNNINISQDSYYYYYSGYYYDYYSKRDDSERGDRRKNGDPKAAGRGVAAEEMEIKQKY